jgi:organic radical activating enzyme
MQSLINRLRGQHRIEPAPAPGLYHYASPPEAETPFRLHLRIEPDLSSLLIVNAVTVLHLNQTATEHAYYLVIGETSQRAAEVISARYRVGRNKALADQQDLRQRILRLATSPDLDPEIFLDINRTAPLSHELSAPYRMDLALTYATDPDGAQDPEAHKRVDQELTTDEWRQVLDILWQAGVPHVTFTGGEPTRRPDLVELIAYAEKLGQVTGLLTSGAKLGDTKYVHALEMAGLDHFMWIADGGESAADTLKNLLESDVFTVVHLTISGADIAADRLRLRQLADQGVRAISLSSRSANSEAQAALKELAGYAAEIGIELVWDLPVPYSESNPVRAEVEALPSGAGKAWMYIEPDGDVLPAQGVNHVLGNVLRQPWSEVWQAAADWARN